MVKRQAVVGCLIWACMAVGVCRGEIFVDDFNTPHDYVADGAEGTIWDDYFGYLPNETVEALNASEDREGQLFMSSENSYWSDNSTPKGPFLFKMVEGDFIATVKVTEYADPGEWGDDQWLYHNDGGLMARAILEDAGTGEDWISIDYFPIWSCGNFLWQCDDGVRDEALGCNNGKKWDLDPWLQLERQGNTFYVRTSPDGDTWTEISCSPKVRNDFDGLPLMVGLRHATYSGDLGYVAFDHFRLETVPHPRAYEPYPTDGAQNVVFSRMNWKAGDDAALHDIYLGGSLEDVNTAGIDTEGVYRGRQDANSFVPAETLEPGQTYYWRVDEVNEEHPDELWKGDVWSFTPVSKQSWNPSPQDQATYVLSDADLTWNPGQGALIHGVYFGTDFNAVSQATVQNSMGVFQGLQVLSSFDPGSLAPDTTYYWRVDETEQGAGTSAYHRGDVWSFTTIDDIPVFDPDLKGWWKLDGKAVNNDIVVDSSGYNRHGTAHGDPVYSLGYDQDAMDMDGRNDYVDLPIGDLIASLEDATIMSWVNFSNSGGAWQRIFDFGTDPNNRMALTPRIYFIDPMSFLISVEGENDVQIDDDASLPSGWHHVTVVFDASEEQVTLYLDNVEAAGDETDLLPANLGTTVNNWLGRSQDGNDAYFLGALDDFRIYDRVLDANEVERAMAGDPYFAWAPKPGRYAVVDVESASPMTWTPGLDAVQHDLYFGKDFNEVSAATPADTNGVYRGTLDDSTYELTDSLEKLQGYYWRVDERQEDGTVTKGMVWTFVTAPYLVVDGMEDYDAVNVVGAPESRIWYTWIDGYGWDIPLPSTSGNGTGSIVDLVTSPVLMGKQALALDYANNGYFWNVFNDFSDPTTSEVTCTFDSAQDWTRRESKRLSIQFYGDAENDLDPFYVSLTDSSGATLGTVTYADDPNGLIQAYWHPWNIDLSEFDDGDLTQVKSMTLGVGNPDGPEGGYGVVYIDEIRLLP